MIQVSSNGSKLYTIEECLKDVIHNKMHNEEKL